MHRPTTLIVTRKNLLVPICVALFALVLPIGCTPDTAERNGVGDSVDFGGGGDDTGNNGSNNGNNGEDDVGSDPDSDTDPDEPDVETDPYEALEGLEDSALKDALHDIVDGHRAYDYNDARDLMYGKRGTIDVVDGMIECVYTGRKVTPDRTKTPGGFNTEHSWPRSDGADEVPAIADIHHLFPVDAQANTARGNQRYGDTNCGGSCEFASGGSSLGPAADGEGTAFEVRADRQGDIARAHFYFSVRYDLPIPSSEEDDLRAWHAADPPDEAERTRNDRIERVQKNRNPFVDLPELVDRIENF